MSVKRANLKRLLNPRHIVFIGGNDAAFSAAQCTKSFTGTIWGVNPNRETLGGVSCFPSVRDLPQGPDAAFIATPRQVTTDIVRQLREINAGGAVCFTAGYGELGKDGRSQEAELVAAAGDMALVGPNCYGFVNYTNGAILWPFGAGESGCQRGVALIMQSGMLPANITMNDRSVPITYVISAGNQSVLAIEDYIDELVDDSRVTGIGIYAEGIKNINKFSIAAEKALKSGKPIVIIKVGQSDIAASLSYTHTGSLAGSDDAFQALFDQLGVIRVQSPSEMLETLKFLSISGVPASNRIAGFTCSGGDAAMLADRCGQAGLSLPPFSERAKQKLIDLLPDIATVTNPLDYTTPVWGNTEVMPKVFAEAITDGFDAAVVIQDFPPAHIHSDLTLYHNDAHSFISACKEQNIPAAICSDLPENIDRETREMLIPEGITPLQGIDTGIDALSNACHYGMRRQRIIESHADLEFKPLLAPNTDQCGKIWNEREGKTELAASGIAVPSGIVCSEEELASAIGGLRFPVALKILNRDLIHKSDAGGVRIGLQNADEVIRAAIEIRESVKLFDPTITTNKFLVETMVEGIVAELLVGIQSDPQFGQIMVIAGGGVWVELLQDKATLLLPTNEGRIHDALRSLKIYSLLEGYRNQTACDLDELVQTIMRIAQFAVDRHETIIEMDVNPLMVTAKGTVAADVMIRTVQS